MADDDQVLLAEFVRSASAPAFRALVERYAGLVRASARRQVRDEHLADDVTQAVFIVLARRASTIRDAAVLPAWLIKTTYFASHDILKSEARRRKHEQKAADMAPRHTESGDPTMADLEPMLDAAMASLKQVDRNIIARRFLQQQSVEEIAAQMKMNEGAVRKRMLRALPKLRVILSRAGITLAVGALATLLGQIPSPSASASVIDASVAGALAGGSSSTPAAQLADRVIRRMRRFNLAIAAGVLLLMLALAGGIAFAFQGAAPRRTLAAQEVPIKIGILISDYSAHTPNEFGATNGYDPLGNTLQVLQDPRLERFAVIEPGTADQADIRRIIATYFLSGHTIDGSKVDELRKLNVLVCPATINMRDAVLDAFVQVVRDEGIGVLNQCATGCTHPGRSDAVNQINGMVRAGCFYNATDFECAIPPTGHVLTSHLRGTKVRLKNFYGSIGVITDGRALITADGLPNHHALMNPPAPQAAFYPMYVSQLGKGRIVSLGWAEPQPNLEAADNGNFYVRCVQWLAKRDIK